MTAPSTHTLSPSGSSEMNRFIRKVADGAANQLVGIYAPGKFEHPIVQQPAGQPVFVSSDPDQVTQFGLPSQFGAIGLLAHNSLAGSDFFRLRIGSLFYLVYGDGSSTSYQVNSILRYQALDPENPYSVFVDPSKPGQRLTSGDLFRIIYTHGRSVVIQTCIEENGEASWGRIFIRAAQTASTRFKFVPPIRLAAHANR